MGDKKSLKKSSIIRFALVHRTSMPKTTSSRAFANLAATQTLEVIQGITPEWLRLPAAMRASGLSRNVVLKHIEDGRIRAKHYMLPGKEKGVWFISYSSLMEFMNALPDGQERLTEAK
jgi:hypothetical protein